MLQARVAAGNPPTAMQMLGFDDARLGRSRACMGDLTPIAQKEGWDKVDPAAAAEDSSKYDGHWVAAPVNIHSTNWIWANKAIFDKIGGAEPKTLDELRQPLDKSRRPASSRSRTAARPGRTRPSSTAS